MTNTRKRLIWFNLRPWGAKKGCVPFYIMYGSSTSGFNCLCLDETAARVWCKQTDPRQKDKSLLFSPTSWTAAELWGAWLRVQTDLSGALWPAAASVSGTLGTSCFWPQCCCKRMGMKWIWACEAADVSADKCAFIPPHNCEIFMHLY